MSKTSQPAECEVVSDEALMELYARGDENAFDTLFQRYEGKAYAYFLKRTGSPERAQDLYQELFLRVHRARDRFDPQRPFAPWFFQIASRLLVDDYRRGFRNHEVAIEDREPVAVEAGSESIVGDREQLALLLDELSPEERYVVLSSKAAGVGYSELATQLGKSAQAIRKMASRAILRLRSKAAAEAPDEILAG